jgi:8-oxo-dGTP pyrophosphatase MutT (NUDIX family)
MMTKNTPHSATPEVLAAGGVVFNDRDEVLFCHPTRTHWHNWRMPKGHVGEGEPIRKAALREVIEETGYKCTIVAKVQTTTRYRTNSGGRSVWKTMHLFAMRAIERVQEPDWENDAFKWVPIDEAVEFSAPRERPLIQEAIQIWKNRSQTSAA